MSARATGGRGGRVAGIERFRAAASFSLSRLVSAPPPVPVLLRGQMILEVRALERLKEVRVALRGMARRAARFAIIITARARTRHERW